MNDQGQGEGDQHSSQRRKAWQKQKRHRREAGERDAMQDAKKNKAATHDIKRDNGDGRRRQAYRGHASPEAWPRICRPLGQHQRHPYQHQESRGYGMAEKPEPELLGKARCDQMEIGQIPGKMKTYHRCEGQPAQLIRPGQTRRFKPGHRGGRPCRRGNHATHHFASTGSAEGARL